MILLDSTAEGCHAHIRSGYTSSIIPPPISLRVKKNEDDTDRIRTCEAKAIGFQVQLLNHSDTVS